MLIDALYVKIRDGQVANRPIYVVAGVNCPDEQAAMKVRYLVIHNPIKNQANVTGGTQGWKPP
jgi:transposase-like protein